MRYGPVIVLASLFGLAVSFAPIFNMGVFLKPLVQEFGWTRTQVAGAGAMATLGIAAASPFVGRAIDLFGPRRLILSSSAAFALAVAAFSSLPHSYPAFLALAALVGVAGAGTTPLAYLALVARWFDRRLGLALGVTMVGVGLGIAVSPLVGQYLLSEFGLRNAFLGMAAIAALAIPNALFVLRDHPPAAQAPPAEVDVAPVTAREVLRTPVFWLLAVSVFLMTVVVAGCGAHMIALITDRGYTPAAAAGIASALGAALLVGRLATGYLLDRMPVGRLGGLTFLLGLGGVLLLASGAGGAAPVVAVALIGFAQGAEGDIMAYAVRRCFGLGAYGMTYGWLFAAFNLGAFSGPLVMGFAFDSSGGYGGALLLLAGFAAIATVLVTRVRPPGSAAALSPAAA